VGESALEQPARLCLCTECVDFLWVPHGRPRSDSTRRRALTTTPSNPEPEDVPSAVEGTDTDAPGAEMGISEEGSTFEPEEDPEA
jgi:hypothetical protein